MSAAKFAPEEFRAAMRALEAEGFKVSEAWLGDYFDGIKATLRVGRRCLEIWSGSENGAYEDPHCPPIVYLGDEKVASCDSLERARQLVADVAAKLTAEHTGWGTPEECLEWAARARSLRQRAAAIKAGAPTALNSARHAEALARGLERRVRMAADAFIAQAAAVARLHQPGSPKQ